jgi:hypothetical protein
MKPASLAPIHATASRAMRSTTLLVSALALCGTASVQALPVIPGAAGFGMDTTAGRGGTVYKVTNLNADGSGSLKACIDANVPRTCVFEVSGAIRITSDLIVRNGQLRIAGQTAPSPGIMIRGASLRITTSDVLVQHIRVRTGDDTNGPNPENRDSLKIEGSAAKPVRNVVIDHCSFSWSIDEIASTWGPHDNITFTNNIFAEPLNESLHPKYEGEGEGVMPHGYGVLFGPADDSSITFVGNLMAHIVERNPLSRATQLVMVNNLVYNRAHTDVDLQSQDGRVSMSSVVGNVFLRGASFSRNTKPILVRTSSEYSLLPGSRVYVYDNLAPDSGSTFAALVTFSGGDTIANLMTETTAPIWNTGLVARKTANNAVYNRVLDFAGARPTDRDSVDKRVVASVRSRTGQIINCVSPDGTTRCSKNAGGWPAYPQNHRALALPANQAAIASNGYSNLENWLNSLDQALAGVVQNASPGTPPTLSVQ